MAAPPETFGPFDHSDYGSRDPYATTFENEPRGRATTQWTNIDDTGRTEPDTTSALPISHITGKPPLFWLALAGILVTAGLALAAAVGRSPYAIVAWTLAGPLAIGVLAVFTWFDTEQRTRPEYIGSAYTRIVYGLICAGAAGGVLLSGWLFANWWARL